MGKTINNNKNNYKRGKNWITKGIAVFCKTKDLYTLMKESSGNEIIRITEAKQVYETKLVKIHNSNSLSNSKLLWEYINKTIRKTDQSSRDKNDTPKC